MLFHVGSLFQQLSKWGFICFGQVFNAYQNSKKKKRKKRHCFKVSQKLAVHPHFIKCFWQGLYTHNCQFFPM